MPQAQEKHAGISPCHEEYADTRPNAMQAAITNQENDSAFSGDDNGGSGGLPPVDKGLDGRPGSESFLKLPSDCSSRSGILKKPNLAPLNT